jgi:hypothetical protein
VPVPSTAARRLGAGDEGCDSGVEAVDAVWVVLLLRGAGAWLTLVGPALLDPLGAR